MIGRCSDWIGATALPPDGRVLVVSACFYYDERLLRVLTEAQSESALLIPIHPRLLHRFWKIQTPILSADFFARLFPRANGFRQKIAPLPSRTRSLWIR